MQTRIFRGLGAGVLLATASTTAAAQVPLTPRSLGMGGAYIATARGHEALFLNPANLALPGTPHWSIAFPQFGLSGTLLGPGFEDLPDLLDEDLPAEQRDEVLATVPASGTEAQFDVRAPLFALQVKGLALGVSYGAIGQHTFSKDIIDLLVGGYEEGRTDYSVGNTAGSRLSYWDFAAGYGRQFGPLSLGVTAHYIRGGTAQRSRMFEPKIDVEARDISVDYVSVLARGGSGYGVDLGAALQPTPALTVSAALTNAFSRMKWTEELRVRDFTLSRSDIESRTFWDLKTLYESSEGPLDPEGVPVRVFETAAGIYDEAFFPAVAKLGVDWNPVRGTHVGLAAQSHVTEGRLAGRWDRMVGVGIQQKLPLITVRAGYANNLDSGNMLTGGLSLGPLQAGVAKLNDGEESGAARTGWIGTFGLSVRTRATIR